uniref:Uncharacterized protein n=1 Tax=Opuntia streptacantha TaxID=393608 RepID=A0A7C8YRW0_OPUST
MSSLTRVERACVRSKKGGRETDWTPLQISAHELMKCHVEVPSSTAWLSAQPIASPSRSFVSCHRHNMWIKKTDGQNQNGPSGPRNGHITGPTRPIFQFQLRKPRS